MLAVICLSYFNPAINLYNAYQAKTESAQSLNALERENDRLETQAESLTDASVLTREARRQGMVEPGERAYVVRDLGG